MRDPLRPFACDHCEKTCLNAISLKNHISRCHNHKKHKNNDKNMSRNNDDLRLPFKHVADTIRQSAIANTTGENLCIFLFDLVDIIFFV